ncbi:MAG TPA: glucose 1-dehydrogenase [Caulobacteraceae bacterium]|nr:glucose 1-dehydrogenase [Caulobacteraceae bacterium]
MKALTVAPGKANSLDLEDRPEPQAGGGLALVQALALGVCGTDREIIAGDYGEAPKGEARLVIGHESLGRVLQAPEGSGLAQGDHVVGIVRRPDPVPCPACAGGEWDMCRNGLYTERGIKQADGYGAERFLLEPAFAIRVDAGLGLAAVLLEPTSVVAKAWEHVDRIGARTRTWRPRTALVTGAGPVGLLAALIATQKGLDTHVFDHNRDGSKPGLVRALGATFHGADRAPIEAVKPDVVIECTGADPVVMDVITGGATDAIICLAGVSSGGRTVDFDVGGFNRRTVLRNDVVFGTVNANRAHYEAAAEALGRADRAWLERLISRRVSLERWREAFEEREGDVKVIIDFQARDA